MTQRTLTTALLTTVLGFGLVLAGCSGGDDATTPSGDTPAADTGDAGAVSDADSVLESYDRGLDFLKSTQKDGIWMVQGHPSPGTTALAQLPSSDSQTAPPIEARRYALVVPPSVVLCT